ncbi:putative cytochrome c oxidase subunit 4 isoform 2 [Scophthalmus maximus]|uniref:Cytochrome c oxidase subunit 4 n=1 Tax=Scophthalmus maximus TaxID=52904 RepID=A0A2U9BZ77_SCOMX|nr:putative cytochrome c oxidase subunit 4 isoform 2 [Scophthalmus maximus]
MLHLTAGRVGSLLARRATAALTNSSVRMASHGHDVAEMVDMSQPLYVDRVDIPLPDRPYKDTLSPAEESLKQKEKGPWSQLSKEEKLALYRLKFCQTFPEMQEPSAEWKTVLGGIFIFLGLTGLVVWWQKVYGKKKKVCLNTCERTNPSCDNIAHTRCCYISPGADLSYSRFFNSLQKRPSCS